ncbi:MAG: hypothetical protein A2729_02170 [Candidatus Buchananbacteria bacterium RIFCSPHIGHO2_01_FULL_39_14]|uniref:Uncharacterized protein n=1 Tax=Candidatus Buchananbacteria bacterium RIFCSPHIGHO2_01_FULL_39_14 TaxID=1797532 RepID=A0A1G1XYQ2_9BACT|nr:MAG: hypothetical protein A2729_02170 [Candidatus Buchananbacteria bacterium RIFCSPHIGHO2_01_FULL_39_14]OGY48215.1 MAG: hypothetical protein A3D39_03775 [Candidatus Buchananbacteria bacterium RIFCSPHIGHO2_02_FULL_39_17]
MEKLMVFLTVLAWIFGTLATIITLHRMYRTAKWGAKYGHLMTEHQKDIAGRHFAFGLPLIIAIVCWAFIIIF